MERIGCSHFVGFSSPAIIIFCGGGDCSDSVVISADKEVEKILREGEMCMPPKMASLQPLQISKATKLFDHPPKRQSSSKDPLEYASTHESPSQPPFHLLPKYHHHNKANLQQTSFFHDLQIHDGWKSEKKGGKLLFHP